ncbi:hypothetical protein CMO92_01440 [Candidatus Woesearchaeota archaeon]|nr:hypothetical protein [Candidatus Woesearchaeota archaeon]
MNKPTLILHFLFFTLLLLPITSAETCVQIMGVEHCCGVDDGVCPMDYEDSYGVRVGCGGDPDPDCCGGQNTRWRECERDIEKPDESGIFTYNTCVTSTYDSACCDQPTDCVYDGNCYDTSSAAIELYPNDGREQCSEGQWCPEGFKYDPVRLFCKKAQQTCHPNPPGACRYLPFTKEWYETPSCFLPQSPVHEQTCCFDFSLGGQDFYNFKRVRIE